MKQSVRKLVIAGGGTAGWMAAAYCRKMMPAQVDIVLVESEDIGIVGVGEATIPPIVGFNLMLGLNEAEFMRETNATFKLAIHFENWKSPGEHYFHTFGTLGMPMRSTHFPHFWLRSRQLGNQACIGDYDLNYLCCQAQKFALHEAHNPLYEIPYAYHFDSALYGKYLRRKSESWGVKRHEGKIQQVIVDDSGNVSALVMASSERIEGDLFIDCTGLRGLLIQGALNSGYDDWGRWLPCNRAVAVQSESSESLLPYTRSIARDFGWQWQIPLTHRNGNGLVYSASHVSDEEATETLMANIGSKPLTEPRVIKFRTGRCYQPWNKNVLAIGLASGFLEPLESTSIHLIQSALERLMRLFTIDGFGPAARENYNQAAKREYEEIRDFIILHYHVNQTNDNGFWQDLRDMSVPASLSEKIALFKETGNINFVSGGIFDDANWFQVMVGQGIMPTSYNIEAGLPTDMQLRDLLHHVSSKKQQALAQFPDYKTFLQGYVNQQR